MSRERRERARARAVTEAKVESPSASKFPKYLLYGAIAIGAFAFTYAATTMSGASKTKSDAAPSAATNAEKASPVTRPDSPAPDSPAPEGMVWIPSGTFAMGCDDPAMGDARQWHNVTLDGFWMDKTEVTNAQFAAFVKATGYKTSAELALDPRNFPGVPPDKLAPASPVFTPPSQPVPLNNHAIWWDLVPGADWQHPEGPKSNIVGRENYPVVQVSFQDAAAYCKWAGKRLPTEAEWEYAARGGLAKKEFVWGNEFRPGGKVMANTWQGRFPIENTSEDGYRASAPVGSYPANGFGLFDMAGNVWEWCSDWYRPDTYANSPEKNPTGPPDSYDPLEPGMAKRVQRGGSFLCTDQYCKRYDPGGRGKGDPNSGANHVGFRCVKAK